MSWSLSPGCFRFSCSLQNGTNLKHLFQLRTGHSPKNIKTELCGCCRGVELNIYAGIAPLNCRNSVPDPGLRPSSRLESLRLDNAWHYQHPRPMLLGESATSAFNQLHMTKSTLVESRNVVKQHHAFLPPCARHEFAKTAKNKHKLRVKTFRSGSLGCHQFRLLF